MRKFLFICAVAALASCNDDGQVASMKSGDSTTVKSDDNVVYPYTATYSSKFESGDAKQAKKVLELWKDWENGDLSPRKDYFADSVTMYFSDGSVMHGPRDSILAGAQQFRNSFSKVVPEITAVLPVRSTDKNEDWVSVWGKEITTDKAGKIDSMGIQESWRFNKDGKIDLMLQHTRKLAVATAKK